MNVFTRSFFTLFVSFLILSAKAQKSDVTINVSFANNEPAAFTTIEILSLDSALVTFRPADSTGKVLFQLDMNAPYIISITSINYEKFFKQVYVKDSSHVFDIVLKNRSKTLSDVIVRSTKPLMRQEDDKTIVDPENLAATSTNSYEILEKTPGLFVDQDGNIYINSTTPATVHINGREQRMSASEIATILKSLPPNSIASIEILRTPSAKYDASGSGGVVNVVLKKGVRIGFTGSVFSGWQQGKHYNAFSGINLNNSNGKLSTHFNMQYSVRNNFEEIVTARILNEDSILSQQAYSKYPSRNFYTGFGISYNINPKWDINYDGRISINRSRNNSTNRSLIKLADETIVGDNIADVTNRGSSFNTSHGFSLKHKMDTLGSEWNSDINFNYAPNHTDQVLLSVVTKPFTYTSTVNGEFDNSFRFVSARSDLVKKFKRKLSLETGIKASSVRSENSTRYAFERKYRYNENINAAYLQGSKNISGFIIKAGSRLENTVMKGHQQKPVDTTFSYDRTDFFPYIYLSRGIMKIAGYELRAFLVYRRTINRPSYDQLNPSQRIIDPYLIESGNPALRPQFTKNYEANISVDEKPLIAFGINETKDIFTQVIYRKENDSLVNIRTYDNLGKNKEVYFRALGAIPPGKRYFFVAGLQFNRNFYDGYYEAKPFTYTRSTWTFFTYHQLKITPVTQFTLQGFMRLRGQMQFYELGSFGALNMSLSQQFMNKKLVVTLSGNDVLYTNRNEFTIQQGSLKASGSRKADSRRFGVNIRYNFGIRKKEENNNMFSVDSPEKSG